jgi:hypothetical protein
VSILGEPKNQKSLGIYDWLEHALGEVETGKTVQIDFASPSEAEKFNVTTLMRRLGWEYFSSTKDNSRYITRIG